MPLPTEVDPDVITFYNELLQEGGLSEEETKLLEGIVGKEKVWKKFKSGLHARSLTDRKMDELKKEQKKFEEDYSKKVGELDSLRESLTAGTDLTKKEKETLKSRITLLEDQIHKAIQKAKDFQDGEEVLKALGLDTTPSYTPPSKEKETPSSSSASSPFNEDEFLKKIQTTQNLNARALAKWAVDLRKMEREYFSLTGKELDPEELYNKLDEKVDDYNGNYYKAFEDFYNIPQLRQQKQEESIQARIDKAVEDKLVQERAKLLIPSEQRRAQESDFSKAIDSTIPADEKPSSGNPMGIDNRPELVNEASNFFNKLREKKESAAA